MSDAHSKAGWCCAIEIAVYWNRNLLLSMKIVGEFG